MSSLRITLEQWRALVAVVDGGSYARAADALHKSQSSVTYAVQQLERQLGVEVFVIHGRKAVLTPTGELLYRRARYLLDEAVATEDSARRLSAGWEAELRVAVETIFPTWLLVACLGEFGAESPHTRIEVLETVIGHRTGVLAERQVDFAIFASVPPGAAGEVLMRARFVLVAHPDHPLHHLGRAPTLRDLRAHRHLVLRESSAERPTPRSVEATQRWTFGEQSSQIEAARRGLGFAWLPEEKIRAELADRSLAPLALREGSERYAELYLIFADRERAGPGALRLAELIRAGVTRECRRHAAAPSPPAARARGRKSRAAA